MITACIFPIRSVEDIIDTGGTMKWLKSYLETKACASVRIACLLDKPARRKKENAAVQVDYLGFHCPNELVQDHFRRSMCFSPPLTTMSEPRFSICLCACLIRFVVGYGMDFAGEYRCMPFIGVLKPEAYENKL